MQVSLVTVSRPSLRSVAPPPCLPLDIKDSLNEDWGFFDGGFDWLPLPLPLLLAVMAPPEQFSAPRTLYIGFRKAEFKKS
jgi:hypothetical protein